MTHKFFRFLSSRILIYHRQQQVIGELNGFLITTPIPIKINNSTLELLPHKNHSTFPVIACFKCCLSPDIFKKLFDQNHWFPFFGCLCGVRLLPPPFDKHVIAWEYYRAVLWVDGTCPLCNEWSCEVATMAL